jgi:ATP-dependent Clp protease ATP-binding subunit ClpC
MFERFANWIRRIRASDDRFSFADLTDRGRRVLTLAQEEARLLGHNFIGTEHILLGLIHEGDGVAANALESLGITLDAVRAAVEGTIGPAGSTTTGSPPFTPRARRVLELSRREALQLGHKYIGTEHMLLGLVREGEGVAGQVLIGLGADLSRVRQQVIQILSGYQPVTDSGSLPKQSVADLRANRPTSPRCGVCRASLARSLAYRTVTVRGHADGNLRTVAAKNADGDDPLVRVALVYCTSCGVALCGVPLDNSEPPVAPLSPG